MKTKRKSKCLAFIFIVLIIIIALVVLIVVSFAPKPPVKEFDIYHSITGIHNFQTNKAYIKKMAEAEFFKKAAYTEWKHQNKSFWLKRDYSESKRMILMAISMAEEANKKQVNSINQISMQTGQDTLGENGIQQFEERVPGHLSMWKQWIDEAINYSQNKKSTVIIIDKIDHRCMLIEDGKLCGDFLIELGINYLKEKQAYNDFATPEGVYYITGKPNNTEVSCYKALFLNFPNKEDSLRFKKAFENHEIPNLDILNDKISLHGCGGKGYNWTDGSIAFSNEDIDILHNKVKVGTKVVIVGSTKNILSVEGRDSRQDTF